MVKEANTQDPVLNLGSLSYGKNSEATATGGRGRGSVDNLKKIYLHSLRSVEK